MANSKAKNDFDPNALTQKTDEHTKILNELQKRVGTNENFGKTFAATAQDSKSLEGAVETILLKLLNTNTDAQKAVGEVVKKSDREWVSARLKGVWGFVAAVLLLIIGALAERYIVH